MFGVQQVLIVGDSHAAGAPGRALEAQLRSRGAAEVSRWAEVGWGPADWIRNRGDALGQRILTERPSMLIYWFGTNDPASEATDEALSRFRGLGAAIDASTWFIGPPSYPDHPARQEMAELLARQEHWHFGARFIDSNLMTRDLPRGADGIHFEDASGERWAERIVSAMRTIHYRPLYIAGAVVAGGAIGAFLGGAFR